MQLQKKDQAELRQILEQRREELKTVIASAEDRIREELTFDDSTDSVVDYNHPADMVKVDADYEKDLKLVERQRAELALVQQALQRLDDGTYGDCEDCGRAIALQRLKAIPFARFCVACQTRAEKSRLRAHVPAISSEGMAVSG